MLMANRAGAVSRFRAHALAVREVAVRIASETGMHDPAPLATAALLHDVGKLVLVRVHDVWTLSPGS